MQKKATVSFTLDKQAQSIFNNIFIFWGTLSREGFILSLAGGIFERVETDPEILVGQKFTETVFWQTSDFNAQLLADSISAANTGKNSKVDLEFRISSKEKIIIELHLQPVNGGNEIFFCAQEITDRVREASFYKQKSEWLLQAAESAGVGLWFWDLIEDKIYSTPKCKKFLEIPPQQEMTNDIFLNRLHTDDRERLTTVLKDSQATGKEYYEEYRVVNSDGETNWIASNGKSFFDEVGNVVSMAGTMRQVTQRKVADEELVKIYAREKKARDEAEEANRAKDFFLAFVSHELRSPLNAILGWTKILRTKSINEETRQNALETIERSARAQAQLINDLVDSARVASGKLRLEFRPVNLYDIVKNVYNSQKPSADAKNIKFDFAADNADIQVVGDMTRLQQVFTNLVTNALKFTPEGGSVEVSMESNLDFVTISVKDSGQGISAEALPRIFSQFSQGDEKLSRDTSGLGLGLSIVKTLVEKHSGIVRAESAGIGAGATFTVILPLTEAETKITADDTPPVPKDERPLNGLNILIVEDDTDSGEVLELFLTQSGAKAAYTESAQKAMKVIENKRGEAPDVIISDLAMPEEDGYSLINRIRSLPSQKGGQIPAIALSAFASNDNKKKAFEAGFQKYHTKPFEPDLLIKEILELVKK